MRACTHDGFHGGEGRYESATHMLRYVLICEKCRAELRTVLVQPYTPSYDAHGNDLHLRAA